MNDTTKEINRGKQIGQLTLISLITTAVGYVIYLFFPNPLTEDRSSADILHTLLECAMELFPRILLLLCLKKQLTDTKTTLLFSAVFASTGVVLASMSAVPFGNDTELISLLFELASLTLLVLLAYDALNGLTRKKLVWTTVIVTTLPYVHLLFASLMNIGWYIENGFASIIFSSLLSLLGAFTLYAALLLFGLNNETRPIITFDAEQSTVVPPSAQEETSASSEIPVPAEAKETGNALEQESQDPQNVQ